jgi:hypothetical protein
MDDLARFTQSLREDLAAWQEATQRPPLSKHASQVAGIAGQLTAAVDSLGADAGTRPGELEQAVGDYLHIWDFFRSKLALRFVPWYLPLLAAADDLAWAAFQPVRDASGGQVNREPPLVYYSRDVIPYTVTRGQAYQGLLPRGGLWTERSQEIASHLVVPVVSLPWQRFSALPVLLSVAHEVGHIVVTDLHLEPELAGRLAAADLPPERRPAWTAWLEEVFADVFSAVVCGGRVALSLAGQLDMRQPVPGYEDQPRWGQYPPPVLRAALIRHVARRRGDLSTPPAGDGRLEGFGADLEPIAAAFLDDRYPQLTAGLGDLYTPVDGESLDQEIDRLARGRDLETGDVRVVLAAATAAQDVSPGEGTRQDVASRALARAGQIRDETRRGRDDAQTRDRDRQAGRDLAALLRRPAGAGQPAS